MCTGICLQNQDCGIDWDGPVSIDDDNDTVTVPNLPDLISQEQQWLLKEELNGHLDEKFGVEHYVMSRAFVSSCHFQNLM